MAVDRGNGYGIDVTALGIGPAQVVPVEEGGGIYYKPLRICNLWNS